MITGIGDSEFVDKSIDDLAAAADSVAAEIAAVERSAAALDWKGDDRVRFDADRSAFLRELGNVERTLRVKVAELELLRLRQGIASGGPGVR